MSRPLLPALLVTLALALPLRAEVQRPKFGPYLVASFRTKSDAIEVELAGAPVSRLYISARDEASRRLLRELAQRFEKTPRPVLLSAIYPPGARLPEFGKPWPSSDGFAPSRNLSRASAAILPDAEITLTSDPASSLTEEQQRSESNKILTDVFKLSEADLMEAAKRYPELADLQNPKISPNGYALTYERDITYEELHPGPDGPAPQHDVRPVPGPDALRFSFTISRRGFSMNSTASADLSNGIDRIQVVYFLEGAHITPEAQADIADIFKRTITRLNEKGFQTIFIHEKSEGGI